MFLMLAIACDSQPWHYGAWEHVDDPSRMLELTAEELTSTDAEARRNRQVLSTSQTGAAVSLTLSDGGVLMLEEVDGDLVVGGSPQLRYRRAR